jgi:hypothetical protein
LLAGVACGVVAACSGRIAPAAAPNSAASAPAAPRATNPGKLRRPDQTFELLRNLHPSNLDLAMFRLRAIEAPRIHDQLIQYGIINPLPDDLPYSTGYVDVELLREGANTVIRVQVDLPQPNTHPDRLVQQVRSEAEETVRFLRLFFTAENGCEIYDPVAKTGRCTEANFAQIFFPGSGGPDNYDEIAHDVANIYNSFRVEANGKVGTFPDQVIVDCVSGLASAATTCEVTSPKRP